MFATTNRRKARPEAILPLFLVLLSVLGAGRADAAAMKTLHARSQQTHASALARYTRAEQALSNYYAQALAAHSLHVFVPPALRNIQLDNGLLHDSSFVAYLRWRRSLAPARFDFYHPRLTNAIITDQQVRESLVTTPTVVTPSSLNPSPGGITPPPVVTTPEPSSALTAALLIAAGFWVKWRSGQ